MVAGSMSVSRTKTILNPVFIVSIVFLLFSHWPLALARFYLLFIYSMPFYIVCEYLRVRWIFGFMIFWAGILFSIISHQFRYLGTSAENSINYIGAFNWGYFFQGHFDAYENFLYSIDFVLNEGAVWGTQLLGSLLFFVPRFLWSTKPISTGAFLWENYYYQFSTNTNSSLAAPVFAEAFINFSYFGVLGLIWFVYKFHSRFEWILTVSFIEKSAFASKNYYSLIFLRGVAVFMLYFWRGSMQTALTFLTSVIFSFGFIVYLSEGRRALLAYLRSLFTGKGRFWLR